jgi:hypothetical protein
MDRLEAELQNNRSGYRAETIQTGQSGTYQGKQAVLSDKTVAIGFCGTDRDFECTVTAISAANYIAACGYKTALVEPDFSKGAVLYKLLPGLSKNGMINLGDVDYYTGWNLSEDIFTTDVVIFDFSSMDYEETFYLGKMKKIFICSDAEIIDLSNSDKLENNSSFRYSVLFSEVSVNSENDSGNNTMIVFKECSQELKRLLKITLHDYGIVITNNTEINNADRINQLNLVRQAELSKGNGAIAKPEREPKYDQPEPFHPEPEPSHPIISAPNRQAPGIQANVPDDGSHNYLGIDSKKAASIDTDAINIKNANSTRDSVKVKYITKEASIISSNNTKNTFYQESPPPSGTYLNPPEQLKKENRDSILPGWLSPGKGSDYEENLNIQSDSINIEPEEDYENKELNEEDFKYDYNNRENIKDNKDDQSNFFNYAEEIKLRFKKKQTANQVLCGKETIFVTGLKHGCGCSHTGISFAKYILNAYSENICICHKKGAYDLEEENITEYTKDTDYDNIFSTNRFIIYDCGILGELNQEQLIELKRCNIKIMVCNGDEKYLGNLAKFIRQLGKSSGEWIFAFNLVTSREKETMIRRIMEGYKICFIPLHDSEDPPRKIGKLWESVLKRNLL